MLGKLVFLVILFIAFSHLSDGAAECSSQDVADSVERRLHSTLVNLTRNQAQVDELLAPVSTSLQAALLKQVLAEYGINPTNTTSNSDPQLNQIREAIVRIDNTLNQILRKLNMTSPCIVIRVETLTMCCCMLWDTGECHHNLLPSILPS